MGFKTSYHQFTPTKYQFLPTFLYLFIQFSSLLQSTLQYQFSFIAFIISILESFSWCSKVFSRFSFKIKENNEIFICKEKKIQLCIYILYAFFIRFSLYSFKIEVKKEKKSWWLSLRIRNIILPPFITSFLAYGMWVLKWYIWFSILLKILVEAGHHLLIGHHIISMENIHQLIWEYLLCIVSK